MSQGFECGLGLIDFKDYIEGDEIECMKVTYVTREFKLLDGVSGSILQPTIKKKPLMKAMERS